MKKIVAILLVLLLAVGLAACNKEDAPDGMKNAAADNAKFFFYVPDNAWIVQNEISAAISRSADGSNVNVTTYLADDFYTAESYWTNKAMPELESTFKEFTLLSEQCAETTMGGIDGVRKVYTASLGGSTYQFMQIIVVKNGTASAMVYTLTYTAKTEHFATHLEDVEEMRVNFAFK